MAVSTLERESGSGYNRVVSSTIRFSGSEILPGERKVSTEHVTLDTVISAQLQLMLDAPKAESQLRGDVTRLEIGECSFGEILTITLPCNDHSNRSKVTKEI